MTGQTGSPVVTTFAQSNSALTSLLTQPHDFHQSSNEHLPISNNPPAVPGRSNSVISMLEKVATGIVTSPRALAPERQQLDDSSSPRYGREFSNYDN